MANTINSSLIDRIYAMALSSLRKRTSLIRHCKQWNFNANTPTFKGDTVVIPLPPTFDDATDITPSNTPPAPTDTTRTSATIQLNNWKKVNFHLTDKEYVELQSGTMSDTFEACIDALARTIVKDVWQNFTDVYQYTGTAGTTPFASGTGDIAEARRLLNSSGVPMRDRSMLLNFDADANAIQLNVFQQYLQAATDETLREGVIRRALGFNWETDAYLPTFTGGTLSDGTNKAALINSGSVAIGDTSVGMDETALTGTVVAGDLFTVAGDDQQYVVTTGATASANSITVAFDPPAKVAWADNAQVTFVADHDVAAFAMGRDCLGFASRLLDDVPFDGGNMIRRMFDPLSGLALTMEISRQYHQTVVEFSSLWGSTTIRPECGVRILG